MLIQNNINNLYKYKNIEDDVAADVVKPYLLFQIYLILNILSAD